MSDGLDLLRQSLQVASHPVLDVSGITRLYGERIGCADVTFRLWPGIDEPSEVHNRRLAVGCPFKCSDQHPADFQVGSPLLDECANVIMD